MSSLLPLFDAPPSDVRREIDEDLRKLRGRHDVGDITAGRHRGAETSEQAYERIRDGKEAVRLQILDYLGKRGRLGGTCEEMKDALELRYTSCSARCSELLAAGRAVRLGATRPTSSRSPASVLVLPEFGRSGA